jgi:hypothetical protein
MTDSLSTGRSRTNGMAIASLILGIVGIFIANVICGALAIIFGFIARRRTGGQGMALAGIILGVIDILLFIIVLAVASSHGFRWTV